MVSKLALYGIILAGASAQMVVLLTLGIKNSSTTLPTIHDSDRNRPN